MRNLGKIALRNLRRYSRRSLLTISLIAFGVIFVLVFVAVTGSFKQLIITQITESYLSDVQVHRRGYVASIESLPLTLNLSPAEVEQIAVALAGTGAVQASSPRIKFGGMFSNFTETTNIRINGVYPDQDFATCPQMASRMKQGDKAVSALQRGTIAAIGTLPGRILSLFLVEGLFLGISGAVVGVVVGTGIIFVLNLFKISVAFGQSKALLLAPTIAPWGVLTASLMVIGVSILASAQPAYKAARMEPIEALRHV